MNVAGINVPQHFGNGFFLEIFDNNSAWNKFKRCFQNIYDDDKKNIEKIRFFPKTSGQINTFGKNIKQEFNVIQ